MEDYFGELNTPQTIIHHELLNSTAHNLKSSAAQKITTASATAIASNYPISNLISFGNSKLNNNTPPTNYNDDEMMMMIRDYNSMIFPRGGTINFSSSLTEDDHTPRNYSANNIVISSNDAASNGNGIMIFNSSSTGTQKRATFGGTRTPAQALDHVVAERKRRKKLGQHFISLSKVVPGLNKLDKASLLEDAIKHLKALKERVNALEQEEIIKSNDESEDDNDININGISSSKLSGLEIKARIMNKSVLLKIFCKNEKGLMSRIPCELEKMQLCVTDIRVMPFGDAALDITILLEMHSEFRGTVKDIVDHLEMVFLKPCDHLR
ncbi:hypothetical protein ACJIZ3_003105 [Penstemon smallii]|uniref:BHLH domain-containing protein n=1 Tax=Penstemon smallii TaxID=265156 RepID=A0ABD3U896_9LAMI